MNDLEQEIIEKINQLDPEARQRVIAYIQNISNTAIDYDAWWQGIEELQAQMRARIGDDETTGMLQLLDDVREGKG